MLDATGLISRIYTYIYMDGYMRSATPHVDADFLVLIRHQVASRYTRNETTLKR